MTRMLGRAKELLGVKNFPRVSEVVSTGTALRPIHGSDKHYTMQMPVQQRQLRGVRQRNGEIAEVIRGMIWALVIISHVLQCVSGQPALAVC